MVALVESRRGPARRLVCTVAAMLLGVAACSRKPDAAAPLMVFAASSLTSPFEDLAREFERLHAPLRVQLHCAGTPQLVLQIREGAPVDVFASADEPNMQKVVDSGLTVAAPRTFAHNRLAILVASGNARHVGSLADLARADLTVALCGPEVPAGRYARQALAKAGVVVHSVSDETNVKALTSKIRLGELDAGIAYETDGRDAGLEVVNIDAAFAVAIAYPIVLVNGGQQRAAAGEFVDFVGSDAGRRILRDHGFVIP